MPLQATLQRELQPSPGPEGAAPIQAVWQVPGSKGTEPGSILILGGQGTDQPDMLYLLQLKPCDEHDKARLQCLQKTHHQRIACP